MTPEFLLTAFIVCVTPGIGVVYTLSMTLGGGLRAGIWAALGCTLATVLHMGVALAGLAALLLTSAVLFQTVKYAGVAYLLWMAWAVLRDQGSLSIAPAAPPPAARILARGCCSISSTRNCRCSSWLSCRNSCRLRVQASRRWPNWGRASLP